MLHSAQVMPVFYSWTAVVEAVAGALYACKVFAAEDYFHAYYDITSFHLMVLTFKRGNAVDERRASYLSPRQAHHKCPPIPAHQTGFPHPLPAIPVPQSGFPY